MCFYPFNIPDSIYATTAKTINNQPMPMILNQEWHVSILVAMTLCVTINTFIMIYRWILLVHLFNICTLALRQLILAEFKPNV